MPLVQGGSPGILARGPVLQFRPVATPSVRSAAGERRRTGSRAWTRLGDSFRHRQRHRVGHLPDDRIHGCGAAVGVAHPPGLGPGRRHRPVRRADLRRDGRDVSQIRRASTGICARPSGRWSPSSMGGPRLSCSSAAALPPSRPALPSTSSYFVPAVSNAHVLWTIGDAGRALEDLGLTARGGRLHRIARLDQLRRRAIRQPRQRHDDHRKDRRPRGAADHGRALRPRVAGVDAGRSRDGSAGRCVRRCDDRRAVGQRCLVQRHLDCRRGEGPATRICRARSCPVSSR